MSVSLTRTIKTVFFWMAIIFLGVMLWSLTTRHPDPTIPYTDFLQLVDDNQVSEVQAYLESNSVSMVAKFRHSPRVVGTTIPYGDLSSLTERLKDSGATVRINERRQGDWVPILLNAAPLILLVGFCLFLMRQIKRKPVAAAASPSLVRTGIGYDLHRLEVGRQLIVGGIELPFDKGPAGHSDGDVLAHALCDALFGAAGLGDIGTHFPDTDPKWKGANSLIFLEHAKKLLAERNFAIEHVDAVVILERPKLGPHFPKMREVLAKALGVPVEKIHLKAKTNEGVDAVGRGEAIAAHVVATIALRTTA
jgi:2-C-methyl-D-erythritol 2,4-cyclodiphosphate synthase